MQITVSCSQCGVEEVFQKDRVGAATWLKNHLLSHDPGILETAKDTVMSAKVEVKEDHEA